jgi:hypothetical protein
MVLFVTPEDNISSQASQKRKDKARQLKVKNK